MSSRRRSRTSGEDEVIAVPPPPTTKKTRSSLSIETRRTDSEQSIDVNIKQTLWQAISSCMNKSTLEQLNNILEDERWSWFKLLDKETQYKRAPTQTSVLKIIKIFQESTENNKDADGLGNWNSETWNDFRSSVSASFTRLLDIADGDSKREIVSIYLFMIFGGIVGRIWSLVDATNPLSCDLAKKSLSILTAALEDQDHEKANDEFSTFYEKENDHEEATIEIELFKAQFIGNISPCCIGAFIVSFTAAIELKQIHVPPQFDSGLKNHAIKQIDPQTEMESHTIEKTDTDENKKNQVKNGLKSSNLPTKRYRIATPHSTGTVAERLGKIMKPCFEANLDSDQVDEGGFLKFYSHFNLYYPKTSDGALIADPYLPHYSDEPGWAPRDLKWWGIRECSFEPLPDSDDSDADSVRVR